MAKSKSLKKTDKVKISKIIFHNKLSMNFREIHADGALGGVTPRGMININFFAERFPIPKSSTFRVNNNVTLGEKIGDSEDSKNGVIREYEFGVYMDVNTAIELTAWLKDKIKQIETIRNKTHDSNFAK